MKTRAASTRRARSDGKGKKEEGEGKNTQRSTLNAQRSTATGNLKPQPAPAQGEVLPVPLAEIGPSPYQTRAAETEEDLAGLAASVAASGILNPLTVRRAGPDAPSGVRWELVCGHRRLAAARLAGLLLVPCVALDLDDGAARLANVVENLQRKDLSPLEEADGVAALTEGGKTAPEIARLLGVSERWVFRRRRLSEITKMWRTIIAEKKAGQVFCERLAALPRPMQIRLLDTELAAKPEPDRIGQALWDAGARDILRMPWAERHPEWCADCRNAVNNTARDGEDITGAHALNDCRFCGNPACLAEKTAVFVRERWDWVRKAVPPSAPPPVKIKREWDAPYPRKDNPDAKHCHAHIVTDGPDAGRILWCQKPAETQERRPKERKEIPGRREELARIRAAHALIRERIVAGAASINLIPAAALLLVYRTEWGIEKWPDRAERIWQARMLTPERAARAFVECAASRMEPWIDEHRYLTQEAHPSNYMGEAEALAGLFGLDEAAIAAKIAEGAADGDD